MSIPLLLLHCCFTTRLYCQNTTRHGRMFQFWNLLNPCIRTYHSINDPFAPYG